MLGWVDNVVLVLLFNFVMMLIVLVGKLIFVVILVSCRMDRFVFFVGLIMYVLLVVSDVLIEWL